MGNMHCLLLCVESSSVRFKVSSKSSYDRLRGSGLGVGVGADIIGIAMVPVAIKSCLRITENAESSYAEGAISESW